MSDTLWLVFMAVAAVLSVLLEGEDDPVAVFFTALFFVVTIPWIVIRAIRRKIQTGRWLMGDN